MGGKNYSSRECIFHSDLFTFFLLFLPSPLSPSCPLPLLKHLFFFFFPKGTAFWLCRKVDWSCFSTKIRLLTVCGHTVLWIFLVGSLFFYDLMGFFPGALRNATDNSFLYFWLSLRDLLTVEFSKCVFCCAKLSYFCCLFVNRGLPWQSQPQSLQLPLCRHVKFSKG